MKCQDFSCLLIGRDIDRLTSEVQSQFKEHLSGCDDCARDWELHSRLATQPVPKIPATLEARCRAAVAAKQSTRRGSGRVGRCLLLGALLSAAAAAAILAAWLARNARTAAQLDVPAIIRPPAPDVPAEAAAAEIESGAAANGVESPDTSAPQLPGQFTVHILPLQHDATNPESRLIVERHFDELVKQLRAVPGLVLTGPAPAGKGAESSPDFVITVSSADPVVVTRSEGMELSPLHQRWWIDIRVDGRRKDGTVGMLTKNGYSGEIAAACDQRASTAIEPCEIKDITAQQIESLRLHVFPEDPAFVADRVAMQRTQLDAIFAASLSQIRDRGLPIMDRLNALNRLKMSRPPSHWDSIVVRDVVDLMAEASPASRVRILRLLRGAPHADFLPPLIRLLDGETDERVRLDLIALLAADFGGDPVARDRLATAAGNEQRPLSRQLALRAVSGEQGWRKYVLDTLEDSTLTSHSRLEPLLFLSQTSKSDLRSHFDDEQVLAALAEAMSGRWKGSQQTSDIPELLRVLGPVHQPAAAAILLEALRESPDVFVRAAAADGLRSHMGTRPDVRAALELVAAEDPAEGVRQTARKALAEALQ